MVGVDTVIITTGYSGSLLNPGGYKKIDQEVGGVQLASEAFADIFPLCLSPCHHCWNEFTAQGLLAYAKPFTMSFYQSLKKSAVDTPAFLEAGLLHFSHPAMALWPWVLIEAILQVFRRPKPQASWRKGAKGLQG